MIDSLSAPPEGVERLTDWGVILAAGEDASTFLHGQLTQDIVGLGADQSRMAGYCSAKGRLLATFLVWRATKDTLALACSDDVLATTLKRLSMFVLRAKCRLVDARADVTLFGLVGASARRWLADVPMAEPGSSSLQSAPLLDGLKPWQVLGLQSGQLIRLPDVDGIPRWLLVQPAHLPAPDLAALPAGTWQALEVRSGIARVTAATADHLVPQMVNLELTGGVNFQKGCYPGQEVVARSQYRGTLKRRMALMMSSDQVHPGQDVFHDSDPGQPAGEVVLSAPNLALVSLKTELLSTEGRLSAGHAVLTPRALPYEVPSQPS